MALIDEIEKDNVEIDNQKKQCKDCQVISEKVNKEILVCNKCFNKKMDETQNQIKKNIAEINEELSKIEQITFEIQEAKKQKLHIIVENKIEIDLLNAIATFEKLKIDLSVNKRAFMINQEQANRFRKYNNWPLEAIVEL